MSLDRNGTNQVSKILKQAIQLLSHNMQSQSESEGPENQTIIYQTPT